MSGIVQSDKHYAPALSSLPSMDLWISSNMATSYLMPTHDPANFTVRLPNTTMISKVVKSVPKLITIPRLFFNVTEGNNIVFFESDSLGRLIVVVPPALYTTAKFIETVNAQIPSTMKLVRDLDGLIRFDPTVYTNPSYADMRTYTRPDSQFARYVGWKLLSSTPTLARAVAPQSGLDALTLPQLGGPQCINVIVKCLGPQQIFAKDGCEIETLAVVPMSCPVGETAFFQSQETFLNDIDHNTQPRNYSLIQVSLRDAWTNTPVSLPSICTVSMLIKLYHVDTLRE